MNPFLLGVIVGVVIGIAIASVFFSINGNRKSKNYRELEEKLRNLEQEYFNEVLTS